MSGDTNDQLSDMLSSQPMARRRGFSDILGIRRKLRIENVSDVKAYVIISPSPITFVSSLGINKIGDIQFEKSGSYVPQKLMVIPGNEKIIDCDTKNVRITIFLEVERNTWKKYKENIKVNVTRRDYIITKSAPLEVFE